MTTNHPAMPSVTTGPITGTVPMSEDDPPAIHGVTVTRWVAGVALTTTVRPGSETTCKGLAAAIRGALADAYHIGRAEALADASKTIADLR